MGRFKTSLFLIILFLIYVQVSSATLDATGGTITYNGASKIHTFTSNGSFTVAGDGTVKVLVIGGGGSGGTGGGGAGGYTYSTSYSVTSGVYNIVVGAGGAGVSSGSNGNRGGNSSFSSLIAVGGGYGGGFNTIGGNGGSGGGGDGSGSAGGTSTAGQGYNGGYGNISGSYSRAGGGGGSGGAGVNATSGGGGNGGQGTSNSITGTAITYACGGGGSLDSRAAGSNGIGGCSSAGNGSYSGTGGSGTANTGSGGGGGGYDTTFRTGGNGGSGIVIISYTPTMMLLYPSNSSTKNKSYPPLTDSINFSWISENGSYNLIVAKDLNFNIIAADISTSNNYSVQSLEAGNYWWKIRIYNATSQTYTPWSTVFNFSLINTQTTTSGAAIQGTIYELINGVEAPVSGALVTLANNFTTTSQTMITGSNGYYLFTGLTNSTTYYVKASRSDIYKDSQLEYVTTELGTWTTKNILLQRCTSDYDCGNNQHYISFYVQDVNRQPYPNVEISIYNFGEATTTTTGLTGTDGVYQARLVKNQKYTITFTHGSNTVSWNNYFTGDAYTVTLGSTESDFRYNLTTSSTRFVLQWSNLNGSVEFTVRNTTAKTTAQVNTSTAANGQMIFILKNITDIYYITMNATSSSGDVNMSRVVDYRKSTAHGIGRNWSYGTFNVSQDYKNYISFVFIAVLAGSFGAIHAALGGVVLVIMVLFMITKEWLSGTGISAAFFAGLAVIIVISYLQKKDSD